MAAIIQIVVPFPNDLGQSLIIESFQEMLLKDFGEYSVVVQLGAWLNPLGHKEEEPSYLYRIMAKEEDEYIVEKALKASRFIKEKLKQKTVLMTISWGVREYHV